MRKYCKSCGAQLTGTARFCESCGVEIPGKYDEKPVKRFLSWMVYRRPNGLYGVGIISCGPGAEQRPRRVSRK